MPGTDWIHPDDVAVAEQLLPSRRVLQRTRFDGTYYHLHYGSSQFRVLPCLWTSVPAVDIHVNDRVEMLTQFGRFEPGLVTVVEVFANFHRGAFEFVVRRGTMLLPQRLEREHFRLLRPRHRLHWPTTSHRQSQFLPPADLDFLDVGSLSESP